MKLDKFACSIALLAGLLVAGYSTLIYAQEQGELPIQFSTPENFQCGVNVSWSTLSNWIGEGNRCGQGLLYTVVGETPNLKDGLIKATIIVPEDDNKECAAYKGEVHKIINYKFEVSFCINTKLSPRPIRLQAYTEDGKKHGQRCDITLTGVTLED
jgi:hypothetical protein